MNAMVVSSTEDEGLRPGERIERELNDLRLRMLDELESFLARALKEPGRRWIELAPQGCRVAKGEV
jgi:hypothetical protein